MALYSPLSSSSSGRSGGPAVAAQQYCSLMLFEHFGALFKYHVIFIHAVMQTALTHLLIHVTTYSVAVSMGKSRCAFSAT